MMIGTFREDEDEGLYAGSIYGFGSRCRLCCSTGFWRRSAMDPISSLSGARSEEER